MIKLHIGYHKTGTSFLQRIIFPNIKNYLPRYDSKRKFKHMPLELEYSKKSEKDKYDYLLKKIVKKAEKQKIFYSNEDFSKVKIQDLIRLLNKYGKFDILITLRNQSNLISSRLSHRPYKCSWLNTELDKVTDNFLPKLLIEHYNYKNTIEELEKNGHKVTYIWFEDYMNLKKGTINKLADYLNFDKIKLFTLFKENTSNKVNKGKKYKKYNFDKYFDNTDII